MLYQHWRLQTVVIIAVNFDSILILDWVVQFPINIRSGAPIFQCVFNQDVKQWQTGSARISFTVKNIIRNYFAELSISSLVDMTMNNCNLWQFPSEEHKIKMKAKIPWKIVFFINQGHNSELEMFISLHLKKDDIVHHTYDRFSNSTFMISIYQVSCFMWFSYIKMKQ